MRTAYREHELIEIHCKSTTMGPIEVQLQLVIQFIEWTAHAEANVFFRRYIDIFYFSYVFFAVALPIFLFRWIYTCFTDLISWQRKKNHCILLLTWFFIRYIFFFFLPYSFYNFPAKLRSFHLIEKKKRITYKICMIEFLCMEMLSLDICIHIYPSQPHIR